jgi:hypothetical protein
VPPALLIASGISAEGGTSNTLSIALAFSRTLAGQQRTKSETLVDGYLNVVYSFMTLVPPPEVTKNGLRSGGSRKSIAYDLCDAASMIRTVLYFEFNSTAASRTKRWKNTERYRVILIEPTAAQTS